MSRRRWPVVIAAACFLAFGAHARTDDPQHYQAALAAVEAMNTSSSGPAAEASVRQMFMKRAMQSGKISNEVAEARFKSILPDLQAHRDASMKAEARIYSDHFSTPELDEITHFYRSFYTSRVGQKLIAEQTTINAEVEAASAPLMRDFVAHLWASADAQSDRELHPSGNAQ